jgi:hypothetical protein
VEEVGQEPKVEMEGSVRHPSLQEMGAVQTVQVEQQDRMDKMDNLVCAIRIRI